MKKKQIAAMLGVIAVGAVAAHSIKKQRKGEETMQENKLTEQQVKENLLRLFNLYEYGEFDSFEEFMTEDEQDLREYAADHYAEELYPYIIENMREVNHMEGDDGEGNEPFYMTEELFYVPACKIYSDISEATYDRFELILQLEIWMLEDGRFAVVTCFDFNKDGWNLVYRVLDKFIEKKEDLPVSFEDLELGFINCGKE